MHATVRSYLTMGIAALGAGAVALTAVEPLPVQSAAPQRAVENLAVGLAASIDPITPWVDTFKAAAANITTLAEFYLQKPFPLLQTVGANIGTYLAEAQAGNADLIPGQIQNNIQTFFQAPWSPGEGLDLPSPPLPDPVFMATGEYVSKTEVGNGYNPQETLVNIILQLAVGAFQSCAEEDLNCELPGQIAPISNFLNTHYSGQAIALLGPLVSPLVQLTRSFTAVGQYFQDGEALAAINELINIPAYTTNAFLNGAGYLDLTSIAEQFLPVPPGTIKSIGVTLGGLLNTVPFNGSLVDPDNPPTEFSGGVGYDSVGADVVLKFKGLPNGWFGSVIGLGQFLGEQMLVTPPTPTATAAAASATPATPAVPATPATPAIPATPATPAIPASKGAPATPAVPATRATPANPAVPEVDDTPIVVADEPAPVEASAPTTGGNSAKSAAGNAGDNGNAGGHARPARSGRG